MAIMERERLEDGMVLVEDTTDGKQWVLFGPRWQEVLESPKEARRGMIERIIAESKTGPDPRSETEQNAREMNEQGQGERHQES